jgi:hypothetical protein
MSLTGIMCNTVVNRFEKVEAAQIDTAKEAKDTAVQIAVLQETLKELAVSLDKLDVKQTIIIDKMEIIMLGLAKDSKRWNEEMDRLARAQESARKK